MFNVDAEQATNSVADFAVHAAVYGVAWSATLGAMCLLTLDGSVTGVEDAVFDVSDDSIIDAVEAAVGGDDG